MIRPAFASLRVQKLPRWLPSSQWEKQITIPILQARSVTALAGSEPLIVVNHPQVPPRTHDDRALIGELRQACTTIRKAMRSSKQLHASSLGSELLSLNQLVGWINTKEEHCDKIMALVSEDGLCQRVNPSNFTSKMDYLDVLHMHNRAMQAATKAKQSMDEADCIVLEHAVEDLANMYIKEN